MSTDIINQAWRATATADDGIIEACLDIRDHSHNRFGIYSHPARVLESLDRGIRRLMKIKKLIEDTHWPTEAEYREV